MMVAIERVEGAQEVVEEFLVEGEGAVLEVGWVEEERVVVAGEGVEEDWVGGERAVEVQEGLEVEGRMGAGLGEAVKVGAEEKTRSWGADRTNLKARPAGQTFLRSHKVAVETICNCSFS